jgi:hypothetical protein
VRGGFGPRFVAEAIFLVVVAAVAGLAQFPTEAIVLVMALAWLLVAGVEWALSRAGAFPGQMLLRRRPAPEPAPEHADAAPAVEEVAPQYVRVLPRDPEPAAQPVIERRPEPGPEPEPDAPPAPEPTPPVEEPALAEPTPAPERPRVERPPEPVEAKAPREEPGPEPTSLAVVPEPEPEPAPAPALEEPTVVALPVSQAPREWNIWELERLVRESAGEDIARDEERAYLLVYMREFATAEGTLPSDFDALVRESFGDLLAAAR